MAALLWVTGKRRLRQAVRWAECKTGRAPATDFGKPQIQLVQIFKGCMPFLLLVFVAMAVLYIQPEIAFWLPGLIYGR